MTDWLAAYLTSVRSAVRVADLVDIAVIGSVVYVGLSWLRHAHSRWFIGGLALLAGLYAIATLLQMHLTTALYQTFIAVAALAVVIMFQSEIRRAIERIALITRRGLNGSGGPTDDTVDILVSTLTELAGARTGALIVLSGREPLGGHVSGGTALNAQPSQALFSSLFDPHSAGHDGAVIVSHNVATRFGVHLPLSSGLLGGEGLGTRHTAALGLSERSDALVLVASEERGSLSVAHEGRLHPVDSPQELRRRIIAFRKSLAPRNTGRRWASFLTRHPGLKALSLVIAVSLWLVAFGYRRDTAVRSLSAPVVLENLPDDWVIDGIRPIEVRVELSGPLRSVERITSADVSVTVDAEQLNLRTGAQRAILSEANVKVGDDFAVLALRPGSIRFNAKRMVESRVDVSPSLQGQPAAGFVLSNAWVDPPTMLDAAAPGADAASRPPSAADAGAAVPAN